MENIFSEDRSQAKKYVAFFDLDRTITSEISGKALVETAWKKHLISLPYIVNGGYLYSLYKLKLRDPLMVIDEITGWVKGKSEAAIKELCKDVAGKVLLPAVYGEAIAAINFHRVNNAAIIMLSSALEGICSIISERLGMDGFICSSLEARDGILTGRPAGRVCFGEEKLSRMDAWFKNSTMNKNDSWYYADSVSDLPVLKAVGRPVCVNPERKLKTEAEKRGWEVLIWHH